jgi:hypothetical protein
VRSPDWLKGKHRLTLRVQVLAGSPDLVKWAIRAAQRNGDWRTRTRALGADDD